MLIIEVLAVLVLVWFAWQLYRAKQFTKFKQWLNSDVKQQVIAQVLLELEQTRSEELPNNEHHQAASRYYWSQYPVRILQFALEKELLTKAELQKQGKWRHCQHLFHVEQQFLAPIFNSSKGENNKTSD